MGISSPTIRIMKFPIRSIRRDSRVYVLCVGQTALPPSPPPGSPGVREKMRVIKKGGALEKRVKLVIIKGGARKK